MSQIGVAKFIAAVALHFPRPKFNEDEGMEGAWMASMNRVLSHYPDEVLAEAAQRILAKRSPKKDGRFFPAPSECAEMCEEAQEVVRLREAPPMLSTGKRDMSQWAGWRACLADELMESASGKQAALEGWGLAFHNFCRDNGHAPNTPQEIAKCKGHRESLDGGMKLLRENPNWIARKALLELGAAMVAENDKFKAKAKGEAA